MMVLRGVGYVAWSWEARYSVAELQRLKNLGFNALALQYFWDVFEKQDGTYDMTSFSWLDTAVRNCEQTGMKIYLCHRTTWGTDPSTDVYTGSWFKAWDKAHNGIANTFDPNDSILPRLARFTEFLVQRYDSSPAVVGYNFENYPFHRYEPTTIEVQQYYQDGVPQLTQAIRKHSNKTIFLSPIWKGTWLDWGANYQDTRQFDSCPAPIDTNTTYLFDGYGPTILGDTSVGPYMYPRPDYTKDMIRAAFAGAINYGKKYNVKIMPDEFGLPLLSSESAFGQQYLNDLIDIFYEFTDSWIHHMELIGLTGGGVPYVQAPNLLNLLSTRAQQAPPQTPINFNFNKQYQGTNINLTLI